MFRIVEARALARYRVWLRFDDGTTGVADLSHLAGRGVFQRWEEPGGFEQLSVGSSGDLQWGEELDLCPDALYMEVTGKTPKSCSRC
jgi:hypothetical protein